MLINLNDKEFTKYFVRATEPVFAWCDENGIGVKHFPIEEITEPDEYTEGITSYLFDADTDHPIQLPVKVWKLTFEKVN